MCRRRYTIGVCVFLLASLLLLTFSGPAAASPVPAPDSGSSVRFEGMIEAIGLKKWLVQGVIVFVDASTEIIEEAGQAEVGAWVTVGATWRPDGNLWADWIRVERPAGEPGQIIEFTGLIEVIEELRWVVGGVEVCIPPEVVIKGQPKVGVPARVRAQWLEGCWQALEIAVYPAIGDEGQVQFEGIIEAMGPLLWVVSGVAVEVDDDTTIVGEPQVGRRVEVTAYMCPGGRLWAQHILVLCENEGSMLEFAGLIHTIHADREPQEWVIIRLEAASVVSETIVLVDRSALVDQSRAVAAPHMWVEVRAYRDEDGALWAQRIRVERPVSVQVEGTLETVSDQVPGWWRVDGQWVYVHAQTIVEGSPLPGMRVSIEGLMLGNGCLWAERVWPVSLNSAL